MKFFAIVIDETRFSIIKRYESNNSTFKQNYPNGTYEHIPDNEYYWDTTEEYGPYYSEQEAWDSAYRIRSNMNDECNDEYDEYEEW